MKARIKFTKTGNIKFIGHLDFMRYFQKAFRRANIPIEYSKGFNPHQIISFAAPLGVGITSDGEYLDMQLTKDVEKLQILKAINEQMAEGVVVLDFIKLDDTSKNSMSIVSAADYKISLKDGYEIIKDFKEKFKRFYNQGNIVILKSTKKSEEEINLKPFIYEVAFDENEFRTKTKFKGNLTSQIYNNDNFVYLRLAAGSITNIKPQLVMKAFYKYLNIEFNEFAFQIHRIDIYTKKEEEFIALI